MKEQVMTPLPEHTRARDYLALTKPWIVVLLLTTTLAAMFIAARGLPPLSIFFFTLLGGACAAGGANALNSYIDRKTDKEMARTSRRPIPAGRISPRRALLFALSLCALSQIILVAFVNVPSAVLSLIGIIYYAYVYTVLLKRLTVQNIVIGGVAGAIPPLVGWAAVMGDLSLFAFYLFAIIFIWTPPHTWALMLLVEKDYRRVGIPMLPAAWGEGEARNQILWYSLALVAISIVPFALRELSWMYLVFAVGAGGWFSMLAFYLWRDKDKAIARRLYRFSNYYLAAMFLMMVLDRSLFIAS